MANIENGFMKSNLVIATASGWLQRLVRPGCHLAFPGETMERYAKCNESNTASGSHGMDDAHTRIKDVTVNAHSKKDSA